MRTVIFAIKFGMTTIGLVLIAIGVLAAVCHQQVENFAAGRITEAGSRFAGTPLSVERVSLSVKDRAIVLHQIQFSNPEGFSEEPILVSDRVVLVPVWNSLFSERPVFDSVEVKDPLCRVEYTPGSGSNIAALLKRIEAASGDEGSAEKREFLFKKLVCDPTRLELKVKPVPVALSGASVPRFNLEEIGTDGPASGGEVLNRFLKTLGKKVLSINGLLPV